MDVGVHRVQISTYLSTQDIWCILETSAVLKNVQFGFHLNVHYVLHRRKYHVLSTNKHIYK